MHLRSVRSEEKLHEHRDFQGSLLPARYSSQRVYCIWDTETKTCVNTRWPPVLNPEVQFTRTTLTLPIERAVGVVDYLHSALLKRGTQDNCASFAGRSLGQESEIFGCGCTLGNSCTHVGLLKNLRLPELFLPIPTNSKRTPHAP
jgi:hypothetical protein